MRGASIEKRPERAAALTFPLLRNGPLPLPEGRGRDSSARERAEIVALAELDAALAQDRVGRGVMEIEIRQGEFDQELLGGELGVAIEALERTMIRRALQACAGNRAEAARRLGIHRQLLYKKLKQFDVE